MFYRKYLKPLLDRVLALLILIPALPIMAIVALAIYLEMSRPILFRQRRPGKDGRIFTIYKFRTMTDERDEKGELLHDELRLKGVGKTIRTLSLDELPQLFNVLKGDMSFVGPRPLLEEYLPLYNDFQARRHEVKPGITGWAQVNGRNAISWEEKFEHDVWYVDHCSFGLDLKILWLTVLKVFKREGISQEGEATMEKFKGSR
ncbi:sugar transferase [Nitratifractor sp.]|uniref:sugar transferase n=1 Tax=Nitratifractor sp. TaxID=2268144 RepID=UPI0025EDF4CC|nr:sugar transferase [Nitratifractor sp.]